MSSRKFLGAVAAVLLVAGYPMSAMADSSAKTNVKSTSPLDAKAFFLQMRPVRPATVTPVVNFNVTNDALRNSSCFGCQPLIVVGVAF